MTLGFFRRLFSGGSGSDLDEAQLADRQAVLDRPTYELVPMNSIDQAIVDLPPAAHVTVTCSPVKGIDATLELTERLTGLGHQAAPHLAARMVESTAHLARTVEWLERLELTEVFVIAGDGDEPLGPYGDAVTLIGELLERAPFLTHVGFGSYPDGHAFIDDDELHEALHRKQALLLEAGITGHTSTQMCFHTESIRRWLTDERAGGFELPVHLGVAGVIDRARLMRTGMRLGLGTSLRYLSKNRGAISRLMTSSSYEPSDIVDGLSGDLASLRVDAMHVYTFNQVGTTRAWLESHRSPD